MRTPDRPLTEPVLLFLRINPPWVFIDEIRRFVESFCACACPGQDREAQLALAVHELMQNAVPNANGEEVELTLSVDPHDDAVRISVTNSCDEEQLGVLRARVAQVNAEPDALKAYLKAMSETPTASRGGLGLARVRYEAQLGISITNQGRRVTVTASGKLRAPRLAPVAGGSHA